MSDVAAELRALAETNTYPVYADGDDEEYMCPNCVTPWKCNGPHIPEEREVIGQRVYLSLSPNVALALAGVVQVAGELAALLPDAGLHAALDRLAEEWVKP